VKLRTLLGLEGTRTPTKRAEKNRSRKKKKYLYSSFPWVEKLNKEGSTEAVLQSISKDSLKCPQAMHQSDWSYEYSHIFSCLSLSEVIKRSVSY